MAGITEKMYGNQGGGSGGDSHNLGYYETPEALRTEHPTANAGDFAIVNSTDTVWIWDTTTSAWKDGDTKGQVTSVNNQTGDVTVQETLVNQTNIKSVNGNSLLGSGNLELTSSLAFPAGWTTNSTTKALCDDVAADSSAVAGKMYLGEVTCSDLPASIANSEIKVEIVDGTTAQNKVILLELTSGNVSPYRWQYTYWNGGSNVSGWKTWQEELVSGTNIKTVNNTSLLGSGNITIDSLPAQSGQSGKFLTTDGTDASWATINALQNTSTASDGSLGILGNAGSNTNCICLGGGNATNQDSVVIGVNSGNSSCPDSVCIGAETGASDGGVTIGRSINSSGAGTVAIGKSVWSGRKCVTIGYGANTYFATGAIQLGSGTNSTAGTMSVALSTDGDTWNNYKLLDSNGTIPTDRFTTTPIADGTYVPTLTIASGTATRTWGAPASGLPSQSGHSGEFLTTDGTDASWSDKPLVNQATVASSINILGSGSSNAYSVLIGYNVGTDYSEDSNVVCIGCQAITGNKSVALGAYARARGVSTIQLNASGSTATNDDVGTMKVANNNGNFELMSADGTIPEARLADTTNASQGQVLSLDSNLNAVWAAPSGGGGSSTSATATLATADWSSNTQTVNVTGVTASNNVIVAAAPASQADYASFGVLCTAQGAGTLTFTCTATPTSAITVNVLII